MQEMKVCWTMEMAWGNKSVDWIMDNLRVLKVRCQRGTVGFWLAEQDG